MDQGCQILQVPPDEAGSFLEVMLACWRGTVPENSTAYRETPDSVRAAISGDGYAVLLWREGETIGCGRFVVVEGPSGSSARWVEIKRVGLLASFRKQGLGSLIHTALEAVARQRGYAGAQLAVRSDQPRLVAYWQSQGYAEADDVTLTTENPLTPRPFYMRKFYRAEA